MACTPRTASATGVSVLSWVRSASPSRAAWAGGLLERPRQLPALAGRGGWRAVVDGDGGSGDRVHHLVEGGHRGPPRGGLPAEGARLGHRALEFRAQVGQLTVGLPAQA